MARRVSFSGRNLPIHEIANHQLDIEAALRQYFSRTSPRFTDRFVGYTEEEVKIELDNRLEESKLTACLSLLASVEAAFRIDYLQRSYQKDKEPISKALRAVYSSKGKNASLEDDILGNWVPFLDKGKALVGELRGAFRFRHWLAHGRYWQPKLGRRYDFDDLYVLTQETFSIVPFFGHDH
jgi:hypothetical protein